MDVILKKGKINSDLEKVLSSFTELVVKKHEEKSNVSISLTMDMVNGGIGPVNVDMKEKISIKR